MQQLLKDSNFELPLFCECQYNIEIQLDLSELRFANFHLEGKCSLAPLRDIRLILGEANFTGFTGVGPSGTLPHRTHGSWTSGYSSAQDTRELDLWVLFRTGHTGVGPLGTLPHKAHGSWTSGYSSVRDTEGWTSGYFCFSPPVRAELLSNIFNFFLPGQPLSECICFLFFPPGQSP